MVRELWKSLVQLCFAGRVALCPSARDDKACAVSYHKLCARQARFRLDGDLVGKGFKS